MFQAVSCLTREALLARLQNAAPRVVCCAAPAGYGKSTLAHQYSRFFTRSATVDCAGVDDAKTFALSILEALEQEGPSQSKELADAQSSVLQAGSLEAIRCVLDEAWSCHSGDSIVIFENTEAIANIPDILSLLVRLAYTSPPHRTLFVCSRVPIPIRANRHLPPHVLAIVRPSELLLDDAEAAQLVLETGGLATRDVSTLVREARGWPILLLVLMRFAREGRLDTVLAESRSVANDELHTYLIAEVLTPLGNAALNLVACLQAVPRARRDELEAALDMDGSELDALLEQIPLLDSADGHRIHSLVFDSIKVSDVTARAHRLRIAAMNEEQGHSARAAMLYRLGGDSDGVARSLSQLAVVDNGQGLGTDVARELVHVSASLLDRYPGLARLFMITQGDLSKALLDRILSASDRIATFPAHEQPSIISSALGVLMVRGNYLAARALIDRSQVRAILDSQCDDVRHLFAGVRETIDSRLGTPASAQILLETQFETLGENHTLRRICIARELSLTYRWTGNRELCLSRARRALEMARTSNIAFVPMLALINALSNAWFWCDDSLKTLLDLGDFSIVPRSDSSAFTRWYHWVFHDEDPGPNQPFHQALGVHLLLIKASRQPAAAADLVARAERWLETSDDISLKTLLHLVQAHLGSSGSREKLQTDIDKLEPFVELTELRSACLALLRGEPHLLLGFLSNFDSSPAKVRERIHVRLLDETVTIGDRQTALSGKHLELVAYLAMFPRGAHRDQIQDALWPDLDFNSARAALYSAVYRLRKRTYPADCIENTGSAYRLIPGATVDIRDIDTMLLAAESSSEINVSCLEEALRTVLQRTGPRLEQHEWFLPWNYKINETARRIAMLLASDCENRGDHRHICTIGKTMLENDPCDEWAHELTIRAMLAMGDTLGAARAYRKYRDMLASELNAEPSAELRQLLGST